MPSPVVPPLKNVQDHLVDAFIAAMISFVISAAMANIFSRKYRYEIDANQVRDFFSKFGMNVRSDRTDGSLLNI